MERSNVGSEKEGQTLKRMWSESWKLKLNAIATVALKCTECFHLPLKLLICLGTENLGKGIWVSISFNPPYSGTKFLPGGWKQPLWEIYFIKLFYISYTLNFKVLFHFGVCGLFGFLLFQ